MAQQARLPTWRQQPLGAAGHYRTKGIVPEVGLATLTADGTGDEDIAFDAVAFEPGNWDFVPDMVIPEADPDAPDPEFEGTHRQKQPNPVGVIGLAAKQGAVLRHGPRRRTPVHKLDYDV
ncbi:hypothetical protein [Streptomyces sp. NPDC002132]|uniref:hypothetical protein n=1 Tax=unclassified Streptomyces TaxID=2593676 RepID=UPI003321A6FA